MKCFPQDFKNKCIKFFNICLKNIQIGLFSATMDNDLEELSKQFMRNPI